MQDHEIAQRNSAVVNISLRDFAPTVILAAHNLFDDVDHCMKADTSPHLAEQITGGRMFITGTLADILRKRIEPSSSRPAIFSPFGPGVLDVAVGQFVLTAAREQGSSIQLPGFFGEAPIS